MALEPLGLTASLFNQLNDMYLIGSVSLEKPNTGT